MKYRFHITYRNGSSEIRLAETARIAKELGEKEFGKVAKVQVIDDDDRLDDGDEEEMDEDEDDGDEEDADR